jgi:hypothetical protein
MPRKKITTEDESHGAIPVRTNRKAAKRVAAAASAPERSRLMSSEEKRQLILAHALERQPVDAVQRFSLWTGVAVCILAITVGWVYTMRQSIASSISPGGESAENVIDYGSLKETIHTNISDMVEEIDSLQDEHLVELQEQAALLKALDESKTASSTENATSSPAELSETSVRGDLFRPTEKTAEPQSNDFPIPPGVSIDELNAN